MAKLTFSKLGLSLKDNVTEKTFINSKGEEVVIEIKTYLPIEEKINMIMNIINQSIDNNGFYNPIRIKLYTILETVFTYTNLSFTEKQKEDIFKLYDLFIYSGLYDSIKESIGEKEINTIEKAVWDSIESIYKYKNSIVGLLETVATNYDNLNLDVTNIQQKLADPENMALLKNIMDKLG